MKMVPANIKNFTFNLFKKIKKIIGLKIFLFLLLANIPTFAFGP